jgi:hypothetical protein
MFSWFDYFGFDSIISSIRFYFHPLKQITPSFIYFSVPDGLWVYSFVSSYFILWNDENKKNNLWFLIPIFLSLFVEIAQGINIFPGTFDFLDLTFCFLALLLSINKFKLKILANENFFKIVFR